MNRFTLHHLAVKINRFNLYFFADFNSNERVICKTELHFGRHMIQIHIVVELVTVLIESNDFSGRDLHFSKYDGQFETR